MRDHVFHQPGSLERHLAGQLRRRVGGWALLYIDLSDFRFYSQLYGRVAGELMLHKLTGIVEQCVGEDGSFSRLGGHEFVAISDLERAEPLGGEICRRWQRESSSFYTYQDRQRGFLLGTDRHGIGRRCPLVAVHVGIVTVRSGSFHSLSDIFSAALRANLLAQRTHGSSCIVLSAEEPHPPTNNGEARRVLVVEPDAALAFLLHETLAMRGYEVVVTSSGQEAFKLAVTDPPLVIILDLFTSDLPAGPFLCQELRRQPELERTLLIVAATNADREESLVAGADLFIPKPFELSDLLNWIDRLVEESSKSVDLPEENSFRGFRR
jgi:PleD family two-component response regulator